MLPTRLPMHRWGALLFFAMLAGFIALVFTAGSRTPEPPPRPHFDGAPSVMAPVSSPAAPTAPAPAAEASTSPGPVLPGGEPAAPAGDGAEKVRFGVLLVSYRGAESSPSQRTREQALARAEELAKLAKTDFKQAIREADAGFEDAGTIQRGVLEPAPEQVLFGLEPGAVGGPVDSPRGYYVFVRLE